MWPAVMDRMRVVSLPVSVMALPPSSVMFLVKTRVWVNSILGLPLVQLKVIRSPSCAARRPALWPVYALSALLAIYSHYYAIAIVLLEQVLLLGWLWQRHFKDWRQWLAAGGCIALAFLPWAIYALPTVAGYEPGRGTPAGLGTPTEPAGSFFYVEG